MLTEPLRRAVIRRAVILCFILVPAGASGWAQVAPTSAHVEPVAVVSGPRDNLSEGSVVVFSEIVDMGPEVPWVRVLFAETDLPGDSAVRVTSLLDGESQLLNRRHLVEWQGGTGFFNGSTVVVEIVAGANTRGNSLRIEEVVVGDLPVTETLPGKAICGADDNRTPSSDPAVGRMLTATLGGGCTGFLIDCPGGSNTKCLLSAGHCFFPGSGNHQVSTVIQFDVPASNANCSLVHPPMTKQFAIDTSSAVGTNGGQGNDWAVFRTFANPMTGRTTFEEQGAAYPLAAATPTSGTVRVTGFGADANGGATGGNNAACGTCMPGSGTGQRHQTQQTHTGNVTALNGSSLRYSVDTCGGNSGGPVIQTSTGRIAGIHTHAGCPGSGSNSGTAITHGPLQNAIDQCVPHMLVLLDRTGSMQIVRASGRTRCEDALNLAKMDVGSFFDKFPQADGSSVSIWTFADSAPTDLTGGFVGESAALAALNALSPSGCTGLTPLAEAMCEASDELAQTFDQTPAVRILAVSSDGGENNSSGVCSGPSSTTGPPYDPGSWQRKVKDKVASQNVAETRFWGSVQPVIDPETGLTRGTAIDDRVFFEDLAISTGGNFQPVDDNDPLPPPIFGTAPPIIEVPTLDAWGLGVLSLLLLGAGMWAIRQRRALKSG